VAGDIGARKWRVRFTWTLAVPKYTSLDSQTMVFRELHPSVAAEQWLLSLRTSCMEHYMA